MPDDVVIPAANEPREIILDKPVPDANIPVDGTKVDETPKGDDADLTLEQKAEAAKADAEKHKSRSQRRLERARTAQAVAEAETKLLREQLAARDAKPAAAAEEKEPQRDDFPDVVDYLKALARFEGKQETRAQLKAEREARETQEAEAKKAQPNAEQAEIAKKWNEREKAFIAETPDYDEVVREFIGDPDGLKLWADGARRFLIESEVGPQVLHQLATDHDLADRISAMSPVRQIAELGKLETKFSPIEPSKKPSAAPTPPTPPKTAKAQAKDFSKMSIAELNKAAKEAGSRWAN